MTTLRLVAADIRDHLGLLAGTILLVAVPLAGFLILDGFNRGVEIRFEAARSADLIVQEANSIGEITGSRIPASIGPSLLDAGAAFAIPEIHAVAGTSNANAVLLRGVDPGRYRSVTTFEVIDGRALEPGDDPRDAFLGVDLAERRGAGPGDTVRLRGRDFTVVGVFQTGTYVDNEAWISLAEAQRLLGWDDDVSIFVIPSDGPFAAGDLISPSVAVAAKGEFVDTVGEWDPVLRLSGASTYALAAAAAIILSTILWRLAWLRRRDLAVLRAMGSGRTVVLGFLAAHGLTAAGSGFGLGVGLAYLLTDAFGFEGIGIATSPVIDPGVIIRAAALGALILLSATVVAGLASLRMRPAQALRDE